MTTSFESKPEIPTVPEMKTWGDERLLQWIQQIKPNILKNGHLEQFKNTGIDGEAFLISDIEFFHTTCNLHPVVSLKLKDLVDEVKKEDELSNQTASRKRKGDERDAPESLISPKRNRQEDPLSSEIDKTDDDLLERVERAVKRRALILQEIKTISQLPDTVPLPDAAVQLSNAAVPLSYAELSNAAVQLSSPATQIKLPFPFVGRALPERFNCHGDHYYWDYMGREKFTELLNAVKELETTTWQGYLFYGTIGYGKSHLLAALACYLIAAGQRVVYIPDCRACAWSPVTYFRAAMLLAWGGPDDSVIQESIMALNTMKAISNFFGRQSNILFIVDHLNVLERDPSGDDLSDETKDRIYKWIRECVVNHKYIFSASADNQNRGWVKGKPTSARQLLVYGGFSAVEMQHWWDRNEKLIPESYTKDKVKGFKSKVEDLTGSIPLLLKDCVVNEKIDLSANALENVATQVQMFMGCIKRGANTTTDDWDTHCEYVRACINGWSVMDDTPSDLIDNRFFYSEAPDLIGKYACGIAREAAVRQLRRYHGT